MKGVIAKTSAIKTKRTRQMMSFFIDNPSSIYSNKIIISDLLKKFGFAIQSIVYIIIFGINLVLKWIQAFLDLYG